MTLERVKHILDHIPEQVKLFGDGISVTTLVGTLTQVLPAVAALVTIIWTLIRIYETKTVQRLLPCNKKDKD